MITMAEIARSAGISRYTVSKVLNGDGTVKEATRKRVLAVCEKYGYVPNTNAVGLVKGRTNLIGVVVPYLTDDFYSEFIEILDYNALERGYQLVYRSSYNDGALEAEVIKNFLAFKVSALIIVPVVTSPNLAIHRLAAKNVPVVYFDRQLDEDSYHVINDNRTGTREMTELLIGKGRHPAYLGSFYRDANITAVLREAGYLDAMRQHGLAPRLIDCSSSREQQDNERFGYENIRQLIASGAIPDALLCVTDAVALGAMRAFSEAGLRPGADVLISGHDNLRFSEFITPSLSTLRQRKELFAPACIRILGELLHGRTPEQKKYMFPPEIILRETT